MTAPSPGWTEAESELFLQDGALFVPGREQQIDILCRLLPAPAPGDLAVELCCGEGLLAAALLHRHPDLRLLAFDGSPAMRAAARKMLGFAGKRAEVREFTLADTGWRRFETPPLAVLSSLALHHLDGAGKRRLFADMFAALRPGGALLIADLVEPASPAARRLAAEEWDAAVAARAEAAGRPAVLARFREDGWNYFADPAPDPMDQPSPLADQLDWLRAAGFAGVDTFWMLAGHAVYGGFRPEN
ncbi:MAG TPA: class I SAM-dependent methyltransferase [Alphaproteobacteria bacterium]|nr:class I SAM-dependent methyltransferase [Alphaproteobacteria bacterium]